MDISDDFFGYIDASIDGDLTQVERFALACQVLRCLSNYITTILQIPATINTIPNQMGLIEWAVEQSFPGYSKARLLKYTIKPRG